MSVHIALLRAVNLGGSTQVAMADLRSLLTRLELADPQTLLQSGNVVFRSDGRKPADLERLLEAETAKRLKLKTDFFVRSAKEWQAIIARNPFPTEAKRDPGRLVVMCMKDAPHSDNVKMLQAAITGPEVARIEGREAYIVFPAGIGRSRLTHVLTEKKLGTRGTSRNWNTVLKIGALAASFQA
jgi:uncharacterized protein (DUF1697 family)